jgi:hypothetical protein
VRAEVAAQEFSCASGDPRCGEVSDLKRLAQSLWQARIGSGSGASCFVIDLGIFRPSVQDFAHSNIQGVGLVNCNFSP